MVVANTRIALFTITLCCVVGIALGQKKNVDDTGRVRLSDESPQIQGAKSKTDDDSPLKAQSDISDRTDSKAVDPEAGRSKATDAPKTQGPSMPKPNLPTDATRFS